MAIADRLTLAWTRLRFLWASRTRFAVEAPPARRPQTRRSHARLAMYTGIALMLAVAGWPFANGSAAQPAAATQVVSASDAPPSPPLSVRDRLRLSQIDDVALSDEGRFVAFTVRRPAAASGERPATTLTDLREAVELRQIYMAPVSGREPPRMLTRGPQEAYAPAWHPDSDRLAFVRPVNGVPQVFVLSLSGGAPYQLTDVPYGAAEPQWGPEGERVLFSSRVPQSALRRALNAPGPSERPGRTPRDTIVAQPPDTLIVLRHAVTLDPADTLAARPDGGLAPRPNRPPRARLDTLTTTPVDSLAGVMDSLRVRRDTLVQPPPVPTAPLPDGSLLQVRKWLDSAPSSGPQVFTRPIAGSPLPSTAEPLYQHYFVVPVPDGIDQGTPPRATPRRVTPGFRTYAGAAWLPLGTEIVVSGSPPHNRPIDRVAERNLYLVSVDRATSSRLLYLPGYALSNPRITPDGTNIAFFARALDDPFAQTEVGLVPLDGRTPPAFISTAFDREPQTLRWSSDGWHLYTTAASNGHVSLVRFAPFARPDSATVLPKPERLSTSRDSFVVDASMRRPVPPELLTGPLRDVQAFSVTDATVVYAVRAASTPPELYANTVSFQRERVLSSLHPWADARALPPPDTLRALGPDSVAVRGLLLQPATPDTLRRPLLIDVASGPASLQQWYARRVLAGRGLAVLVALPRTADGYGAATQRQAAASGRRGAMGDVLALADTALARPSLDSTRQVLMGRGRNAPLAAWMATQTNRFEAVLLDGGTREPTALLGGRRDSLRTVRQLGGMPWEGPVPPSVPVDSAEAAAFVRAHVASLRADTTTLPPRLRLQQRSPLTYASRLQAPLLLMSTAGAPSSATTERLYRLLTALRRPVEWARYPDAASTLGADLDRLLRVYEFAARFTDGARPAPRPPAAPDDD